MNEILLDLALPKTWKECLQTLNNTELIIGSNNKICDKLYNPNPALCRAVPLGYADRIRALCQLLVCWKAWCNEDDNDYDFCHFKDPNKEIIFKQTFHDYISKVYPLIKC